MSTPALAVIVLPNVAAPIEDDLLMVRRLRGVLPPDIAPEEVEAACKRGEDTHASHREAEDAPGHRGDHS